jgi:hypothetical protein
MAEFAPPQEYFPPAGGNADATSPSISNVSPGQEFQKQWARSVARSAKIKNATTTITHTRSQFVQYLRQGGLDLWTSAVEFQQTGDFIISSYVIYPKHNDFKEPLAQFLRRYPNLQPAAIAIRDAVRPAQSNMQVVNAKQERIDNLNAML